MISVVLPLLLTESWQVDLTRFCIQCLKNQPGHPFNLIIVETESREFEGVADLGCYVHRRDRTTYVEDFNAGQDAASGDFIVHIGNDVIVRPGWLSALLECFKIPDCGIATLACTEPGAFIGARKPQATINEGMYGPICMWKQPWRLDPAFAGMYSDNDLVMRMYGDGLRAYRNNSVQCHHLNAQTWSASVDEAANAANLEKGKALFYERWGKSPLWMRKMITTGHVIYGREHE